MDIDLGDKIPTGALATKGADGPDPVITDDLHSSKKVVLFAVPDACTPTCSAPHLQGFVENADATKDKGVDTIACLSVNEAFVMDAWGRDQNTAGKVEMLADGSAALTKEIGTVLDLTDRGLGMRSSRYSLIVDDGNVTQINLE